MTLDECKRIHRDMWNYIVGAEDRNETNSADHSLHRIHLKDDFCSKSQLSLSNNCALCEYALDQYHIHHNKDMRFSISYDVCTFCPAIWGTEVDQYGYYCERGKKDDGLANNIDWRQSKADAIRDIKWKDEV